MSSYLLRLLSAALLGAALFAFSLPASAAENTRNVDGGGVKSDITSPRDHASGLPTGRRAHFQEQIVAAYESLAEQLKTLQTVKLSITGQAEELARLLQEEHDAAEQEADAAADLLSQLDSAEAVFSEQVAPLLDSDLVQQISAELQLKRGQAASSPSYDDDADGLSELQALQEAIAALEASLSELETTTTEAMRRRGDVKFNDISISK